AVVVVWRTLYRATGHGTTGSGAIFDPVVDPGAFLAQASHSWPLLLASDVVAIPPEALFQHPELGGAAIAASLAIVGLLALALVPQLRTDRSTRLFALGAVLSVLPLGGTFPSDRYLFWTGLGVIGVMAQLAGSVLSSSRATAHPLRLALCCGCIFVRTL